ncbi:hypothetical protein [Streptomyces sp. TLI_105]|uniref:hypothetical protein n=1 Tax=Streptomyces sp. TLI_105 TaxID=1881019 RepID=UPI00089B4EF0|nr:hypothetical protein [Streptomyces sp. TLI_105]SED64949.1 hypothetical protein SAMN05428939_5786 [Streptomyces sp. TLI_105]
MDEPDGIDWGALRHAYGSAADVPERLRALYLPEEAEEAAEELHMSLYHQGGCVDGACVAALPFLVRAAADPVVTVRVELLELVRAFAHEGNRVEPRWIAPGWAEAWAGAVTVLLPLLHDPSPGIRRKAADAVGEAWGRADDVLVALWARWPLETVPEVRHRIVRAAGPLAAHAGRERESTLDRLWELTGPDTVAAARIGAVEALRAARPGRSDARYARVVTDVLTGDPAGGGLVLRAVRFLDDDRATRTGLISQLLGHPDTTTRRNALEAAAGELGRWRSAVSALLPAVAARLDDPEPENRLFAARVLGMCGTAARPWADRLAALTTDEGEPYLPAQDHALWALSRSGDPRCAEPLARRLAGERLGFATYSVHSEGWWTHELSLHETLGPLAAHAEVLLPPLRAALADAGSLDVRRALCQVLTDWGPAAAPAIPELIGLLETDGAVWALDALAAIGPEAAAAMDRARLRILLRVPPPGQPFAPAMLALAYGRLTGDREPARELLLPTLSEPYGNDQALVLLGELGAAGAPYADRLRELLHRDGKGRLPGLAGEALWRVTGPAEEVVPVLVRALESSLGGGAGSPDLRTVRLLGRMGPAAAPAVPVLRVLLDTDERPVEHGSWRSVPEDDELCAAARRALRAISGETI